MDKEIKELGKERIILRELRNYECFYTEDIEDAIPTLESYGITVDEILKVFREKFDIESKNI